MVRMSPPLSHIQFQYHPPEMGAEYHRVTAHRQEEGESKYAGYMAWSSSGVRNIDVAPAVQRQGIGTALWNEGHRLASEHARVPKPKHSKDRTNEGDAWARSVGGRLPKRTVYKGTLGEARPA
jgi:GNAT superfamily N-acetyltransferase